MGGVNSICAPPSCTLLPDIFVRPDLTVYIQSKCNNLINKSFDRICGIYIYICIHTHTQWRAQASGGAGAKCRYGGGGGVPPQLGVYHDFITILFMLVFLFCKLFERYSQTNFPIIKTKLNKI